MASLSSTKTPRRTYARPSARRSQNMRAIRRSKNKSTELALIAQMRKAGIKGWRRAFPVYGSPDFVFRNERVAVFVDGCFWHGCPRCYRPPRANALFWKAKLLYNKERDLAVNRNLRRLGWRVVRIWEHRLRHSPTRALATLNTALRKAQLPTKTDRK